MLEILKSMVREEWRIHASMFGGSMFVLFPVLIAAFTFGFSLFIPMFETVIPLRDMYMLLHYLALLFGVSVGGFGLIGREMMNRRFGQASMVAYSSRTLPVSERRIFMNLVANDTAFYFLLYMIPFFFGLSSAALFTGAMPAFSLLLLSTIAMSFIIGMSAMFLLSTLYAHFGKAFIMLLLIAMAAAIPAGKFLLNLDIVRSFPPLAFFYGGSAEALMYSIFLMIVPGGLSLLGLKIEFPESKRRVKNGFDGLSASLGRVFSSPHFVAKDMLDMHRSEGGIGKIVFSFIFPLVLIWAMLYIFSGMFHFPPATMFLIFSVLVGALSSSIYNWLTEFDIFSSYSFLPVKVSDLIKGKLKGFAALNITSVAIIIAAALLMGQVPGLVYALPLFAVISAYTVSSTIFIAGLSPNIVIYSGKVFLQYLASIAPVMVLSILGCIMSPPALFFLLLAFAMFAGVFLRKAYAKWDEKEQPMF